MYTVKYYDDYIYIPGDKEFTTLNPELIREVNKAGKLTFTILDDHPLFGELKKLKYGVVVENNGKKIFKGRIIDTEQGFDKSIFTTVEGKLAALNDSPCRPYSFKGSPEELFRYLLENHNSQVGEEQKFKIGIIDVTDSNNYISRTWEKPDKTLNIIKSRLIDTLGGFLRVRYEEDGDYLDWLAEITDTSNQKIEFGKNLLELNMFIDAAATYTACIPYGAKDDAGNNLTIKAVNNGIDYIINQELEREYGTIYAPTEETTWEDVTRPENLLEKAEEWLRKEGIMLNSSINLSFLDLSKMGINVDEIDICSNVNVISKPHGFEVVFLVEKMALMLDAPEDVKITIGKTLKTLTDKTLGEKRKNNDTLQRIVNIERASTNYVTNEKVTETIDEALKDTKPYLHIKYSPVESPTAAQMTTAPNEETIYIGLSHTASKNAPTNPTAYTWQKVAGDPGPQGIRGYSVVASVSRPSFTEENWNTYGTIGHFENWSNTENIRNGCRIGDIFTVVGTATDTGKAHVLYYRSTTASGTLYGECIAHSVANKGDMGISVDGVQRYYILQNTEPIKPNSYPPPNEWLLTEPLYEEGSTNNLYFVDCVIFSNKTYTYSNVSLSTSYEAAKAAYNKASIVQEDLNETNKKLDDEINKVKELYSSAIDQSAREIKLEVSKEYATKEDIKTESTRITQLSSSLEIAVKTANDVKNTFQFLPEGFRIGRDNSEIYSVQDNDSFEFKDKSNEPLLTIAAASGVTAPNVNIKKQLTFFEKWAMRKGEYVNGKGYNLNDLWIGG